VNISDNPDSILKFVSMLKLHKDIRKTNVSWNSPKHKIEWIKFCINGIVIVITI
jgi:hypothetical protein